MLPKPRQAVAYQLLTLSLAALVVFAVSRFYPIDSLVRSLHGFVERHQPWSTVLYPFVHAVCNLLLLPAGALVIGSGFIFGLWQGFLLALTGHLLAAAGAFGISRTFGRRFIERHLASRPQWRALDAAIEREGWKIVFLSQLSPLLPTSLFNYCYGLTWAGRRACSSTPTSGVSATSAGGSGARASTPPTSSISSGWAAWRCRWP